MNWVKTKIRDSPSFHQVPWIGPLALPFLNYRVFHSLLGLPGAYLLFTSEFLCVFAMTLDFFLDPFYFWRWVRAFPNENCLGVSIFTMRASVWVNLLLCYDVSVCGIPVLSLTSLFSVSWTLRHDSVLFIGGKSHLSASLGPPTPD